MCKVKNRCLGGGLYILFWHPDSGFSPTAPFGCTHAMKLPLRAETVAEWPMGRAVSAFVAGNNIVHTICSCLWFAACVCVQVTFSAAGSFGAVMSASLLEKYFEETKQILVSDLRANNYRDARAAVVQTLYISIAESPMGYAKNSTMTVKVMGQHSTSGRTLYAIVDGHHRHLALTKAILHSKLPIDYKVACNVYSFNLPRSLAIAHAGALNEANDDYGKTTFMDKMSWIDTAVE